VVATFRDQRWHLWLDPLPRPGALNMAIDQTLLERAGRHGERWLRLYRWHPHCLSFGRHERAAARYDRGRIEADGLAIVRRPTGGRAVWHAGELTYAVSVPADEVAGLRGAYLEIHRMLLDAVCSLGADAALAPAAGAVGLEAGACFARPVGGEIVVSGRKVVGSAQLREGGGLLQHGSILLDDDQSLVGRVTAGHAPADGSAPLSRLLRRPVSPEAMARAVADAASARWAGVWSEAQTPGEVLAGARAHLPRFASAEWTWRA
jgi:lipoate-protein ligase A